MIGMPVVDACHVTVNVRPAAAVAVGVPGGTPGRTGAATPLPVRATEAGAAGAAPLMFRVAEAGPVAVGRNCTPMMQVAFGARLAQLLFTSVHCVAAIATPPVSTRLVRPVLVTATWRVAEFVFTVWLPNASVVV